MISVCIATYNGAKYIKEQLDSILIQLNEEDEIIISDDGSNDETLNIIESYNDKRIKIFNHIPQAQYSFKLIRNMNLATKNFEHAIKQASGDIIFLADQDDIWLPNKLSVVTKEMKRTNAIAILHNLNEKNEYGIIETNFYLHNPIRKNIYLNYLKLPFMGCCMAFKKELIENIIPFKLKTISHDQLIGLSALHNGIVTFIDIPLIIRRIHLNNSSLYTNPTIWDKIIYNYHLYHSIIFDILLPHLINVIDNRNNNIITNQ